MTNSWIHQYERFLQTHSAQARIPKWFQELQRAQLQFANDDDEDEDYDEIQDQSTQEQDEWMQLCQLNPTFSRSLQTDATVDWEAAARSLPPHLLRDAAKWITVQRHLSTSTSDRSSNLHNQPINVDSLNHKQRCAYTLIQQHHTRVRTGENPQPLYMIISGTAGTGKSYLISAVSQLLGRQCLLTSTTGMASFNISEITLHSALSLPVHRYSEHELQGNALQQLQLRLTGIKYIIIDEMSMMGLRMFAWVDKRLRQATGKLDSPFGGLSIILIGDFGQLPPVGDKPLYSQPTNSELSTHGHHIYQLFTTIVLDQVLRQSDTNSTNQRFRDLLKLRDGTVTHEDWQMLLQRDPNKVTNTAHFEDALHLYYDKQTVISFNTQKLLTLNKPIAMIKAIHNCTTAASAKPNDAGGLYPAIFVAEGAYVMLTANLWQQVGLCNGAAGTIHSIYFIWRKSKPTRSTNCHYGLL